jgi:acetyltransferase-like isoleucine patch superfamily enzyme
MQMTMALPRFSVFNGLKASLLRRAGASIGRRVIIYPGVWIMPMKNLWIGDDVDLARGVLITTSGTVRIGSRTLVGYGCRILSANHRLGETGVFGTGHSSEPVTIGDDVWLASGVTVLPGVTIGDRSVIGAGAVVTGNIPCDTFAAGVPARVKGPARGR